MKKSKQMIEENKSIAATGAANHYEVPISEIVSVAQELYFVKGYSLKLITATDERAENGCFKVWYVFGDPETHSFHIPFIVLKGTTEFPSLTPSLHEACNYERLILTFFGLTPMGHPDMRPLNLHENWPQGVFPLRKDFDWQTRPAQAHRKYAFQKVGGEGIYEIPVGPIHAGIIEPGHFRFSVAGESIVALEARLGYVHKGSEKLFEALPLEEKVRLSEKISGDSSFSHSLAFCQAVEQLGSVAVPKRALYLRVIYAELERIANHFGDIGAMMTDTGFNFGGAQGSRLREMILQIHEGLTSSRFLRGVNAIGGVTKDISSDECDSLWTELAAIEKDYSEVIAIAENSTSLLNRMKETGTVSPEVAKDRGVVGVAGRAIGITSDTRIDYPYAAYGDVSVGDIPTEGSGDAYARFRIRIKEVHASIEMIQSAMRSLPPGEIRAPFQGTLKKNAVAVSCVEGWRGEIAYFVTTDEEGAISRVAPRDPSFVNWGLLPKAAFDNVVPDFPLINKSFNLSYSGNDL